MGKHARRGTVLPTLARALYRQGRDYVLGKEEGLTLLKPPGAGFMLEVTVATKPQDNTQLSGLYKTSGNYCTQCEAVGFRRITYFLDRRDAGWQQLPATHMPTSPASVPSRRTAAPPRV